MNLPISRVHFADIARDLTEGITAGRYPVGSLLPTELELRDHYKTSRHTVRAALHELQQLGLVSRRKNVGTRVESVQPRKDFRSSLASLDDLVQFGSAHIRALQAIEETTADGALAKELDCADGTHWLRISSLRMDREAGSRPIGWTDVYVDPQYADIGSVIRESPGTLISTLIEARYGRRIAEVRQVIRAVAVSDSLAPCLKVEAGTPGLQILRWYYDAAGQVFEVSVTVHPADRFSVEMRLHRAET